MTKKIQSIANDEFLKRLAASRQAFHEHYYAMYSSVVDAITTDPTLMLVPADDHIVHRGDGVFETLKCVDGALYNVHAHLKRLRHSATGVSIDMDLSDDDLVDLMKQTIRAGQHKDCLLRLLLSRGPGSLGVNPYDSKGAQIYVIAYRLKPPFMEQHPEGACVGVTSIPLKYPYLATIKTCNYLPNALMAKEAADKGVHFVIALDADGQMGESATENMILLSPENELLVPMPDQILTGTTMQRAAVLAEKLVQRGLLAGVRNTHISLEQIQTAPEAFIVGTTPNITAVVEFSGHTIGSGKPGPIYEQLSPLLLRDIHENSEMRTEMFED